MIRILLAEDDDVMREYLARALTGAGYHVTAVDRGTEAVPYIDSGTFDRMSRKPSCCPSPFTSRIWCARSICFSAAPIAATNNNFNFAREGLASLRRGL